MRYTRKLAATFLAALSLSAVAHAQSGTCGGDTNGDGVVNAEDLAQVLTQWGTCPAVINSVTPNQGGFLGGTVITITGANLTNTYEVTVGGASCTNVAVLSPTSVRATTPAGSPGPASIAVRTLAGTTLASAPFTYLQSSISSVVPSLGIYTGGTAITITGTNLSGATSVTVGGVPATNVVAVSSTTVTAVTPAGSVGAVNVTVSGPKNTATAAGGFAYFSQVTPSWATLVEEFPDPAVVTDATLRAAITASGLAWRVRDTATQIEMVLVPGGTFTMGCTASNAYGCSADENPTHSVTITNAFYMGRYEVTQAQWQAKMGSNPSYFQGQADSPSRPVEQVSWNTIQGFLTATGMQLPTEAQWEYACRAGTTTAFHGFTGYLSGTNDDTLVVNIAWYTTNAGGQTHAVGGKAANALGLHDMLGNVWEWCGDWYGDSYSSVAQTNPAGPATGSYRVLRGGPWGDDSGVVRSSNRDNTAPGRTNVYQGFRVARAPL